VVVHLWWQLMLRSRATLETKDALPRGFFATRLGGPALALNPHWCGDIAEGLATAQGVTLVRTAFHDRIENAATKSSRAH